MTAMIRKFLMMLGLVLELKIQNANINPKINKLSGLHKSNNARITAETLEAWERVSNNANETINRISTGVSIPPSRKNIDKEKAQNAPVARASHMFMNFLASDTSNIAISA